MMTFPSLPSFVLQQFEAPSFTHTRKITQKIIYTIEKSLHTTFQKTVEIFAKLIALIVAFSLDVAIETTRAGSELLTHLSWYTRHFSSPLASDLREPALLNESSRYLYESVLNTLELFSPDVKKELREAIYNMHHPTRNIFQFVAECALIQYLLENSSEIPQFFQQTLDPEKDLKQLKEMRSRFRAVPKTLSHELLFSLIEARPPGPFFTFAEGKTLLNELRETALNLSRKTVVFLNYYKDMSNCL